MKQILVVEDVKVIQTSLKQIISQLDNTNVVLASNGSEAISIISHEEIDLLITDVQMPEMNGIELIKQIRSNKLDIPIIIISGFDEFGYAKAALELGVSSYILKPLNQKEILEKVSAALMLANQNEIDKGMIGKWMAEEHRRNLVSFFLEGKKIAVEADPCFGLTLWGDLSQIETIEQDLRKHSFTLELVTSSLYEKFFLVNGNDKVRLDLCQHIEQRLGDNSGVFFCLSSSFPKLDRNIYFQVSDRLYGRFFSNAHSISEAPNFSTKTALSDKLGDAVQKRDGNEIENILRLWFVPVDSSYKKSFFWQMTRLMNYLNNHIECQFDTNDLIDERYLNPILNKQQLIRFIMEKLLINKSDSYGDTKVILYEVKQYIENHFTENITLNMIAKKFGLSQAYMSTAYSKQFGMTPSNYLTSIKMKRAEFLLLQTKTSINSISEDIGYENVQAFYKAFKSTYKTTPLKFRSEK